MATAKLKPPSARANQAGAPQAQPTSPLGHWFGPPDRPLCGWLSLPARGNSESGVLILPAVGYQYWSSHLTLRTLAERLAQQGYAALRIDYDGTGDSSGDQWEGGRLAAWRASVLSGVAELRGFGCQQITLVGARLGATLALLDAATLGADAVVAWAPVLSGKRYASELRLLGQPVPASAEGREPGSVVVAGCVFTAQTLEDLAAISLLDTALSPPPRALVVSGQKADRLIAKLRESGCEAEQRIVAGGEQALEVPTEYATVPGAVVDAACEWVGNAPNAKSRQVIAPRFRATLPVGSAHLSEEVITLGKARLVAVSTEPSNPAPGAATVVFLNTGSESHVGPGRAWVEYARALALRGHHCVRADFRGFGESPDYGFAPGRPYDAHCEADTVAIVEALRAQGAERIVLVGLCASSWIALRAVLQVPVDGVIALNPQLYWQPGDPVEATMAQTRQRRTPTREREALGARLRLWTALDMFGIRPRSARWLDTLRRRGTPITLLFAAGDDGIEYLETRTARRFRRFRAAPTTRVLELPDIDHSMHRAWLRDQVINTLSAQLDAWFAD